MPDTSEDSRGMERHVQTGIQLLIVGLLGWNFMTVQSMAITIARQEEKLIALTNTLTTLSAIGADDRYRGKDAGKDFALRDRAIVILDDRMTSLEHQVMKINQRMNGVQ